MEHEIKMQGNTFLDNCFFVCPVNKKAVCGNVYRLQVNESVWQGR